MARYAEKTSLVKKVFGKSSGRARYSVSVPMFNGYLCTECGFMGIVVTNKKSGVVRTAPCECVGDSQLSIRIA